MEHRNALAPQKFYKILIFAVFKIGAENLKK